MLGQIEVKELDQKRFDALAGHSRSPAAAYFSAELAWYSNEDESVIGVVLLDTIDRDFAAVLLGRDESGAFRAFDQTASVATQADATAWVAAAIKWHTGRGKKVFPQGEEKESLDLFTPVVPLARQHPYFVKLTREPAFLPARSIVNEMMPHFVDVDGNFVEQFQSTGFDARLWELYINSYLTEELLFRRREHSAPDFIVQKYGQTVAIEAVIVGRKLDNPPTYFREPENIGQPMSVLDEHAHAMPIRFGSPLYSKLQKKYWTLPHVAGNPLIFAIADFHDDQSMLWSGTALMNYLYGVRHDFDYDEKNQLIISPIRLETHKVGDKEIPSGFFFQPEAEHISAVLFSASGTISKFNRIGRQAGFCHPDVVMIRVGTCHNHDPNASLPKLFRYTVDESSTETWAEGLSMFHNPKALHPVPEELFPSIAHHYFDSGQIVSHLPQFHPYSSITLNMRLRRNNG
jgi:hypothetical protein